MIVRCERKYEELIEKYIGEDYYRCLYLYMNLRKYGIISKSIDVFVETVENEIRAVYLIYFSCIHVYSKDNRFDVRELENLLGEYHVRMIYCERTTATYILDNCIKIQKDFSVTYGWVAKISRVDKPHTKRVQLASISDFDQIVSMIFGDEDIGRSYDRDELVKQLFQRSQEGYARNYVIKENDLVIAHACTNAEIDRIAVVAELIVNERYRRNGYALEIWRAICEELLNENKQVFSFYYSNESRNLHKKIGFQEICEWGKIVANK